MVDFYHSESDRGAAVLAGSYVEHVLGIYLHFRMVDKTPASSLFESNGALSSFSQRIGVAQAYGFIDSAAGEALTYVRKIRNHFAHHPLDGSFEKSPVKELAERLRSILPLGKDQEGIRQDMSRRNVYLLSCGVFALSTHVKMGDNGIYTAINIDEAREPL